VVVVVTSSSGLDACGPTGTNELPNELFELFHICKFQWYIYICTCRVCHLIDIHVGLVLVCVVMFFVLMCKYLYISLISLFYTHITAPDPDSHAVRAAKHVIEILSNGPITFSEIWTGPRSTEAVYGYCIKFTTSAKYKSLYIGKGDGFNATQLYKYKYRFLFHRCHNSYSRCFGISRGVRQGEIYCRLTCLNIMSETC